MPMLLENMLKLVEKDRTMKFREILTKTEQDISKNCNFALGPLFPCHFTRNPLFP